MATSPLALPRIVSVDSRGLPPNWRKLFIEKYIQLHLVVLYENSVGNGKLWPAYEIVSKGVARGDHHGANTIIDSTSGNYGTAVAQAVKLLSAEDPAFPIEWVLMVVAHSLPQGKRDLLLAHGIKLIDADDAMQAMTVAETLSRKYGYWYTCQYKNTDNTRAYAQIAHHMANELPWLAVPTAGVGSGGGFSGTMLDLTERFENRNMPLHRVAVVLEDGEKVGGVRDEALLEPGTLDWRRLADRVCFVRADPSYSCSAGLWDQGLFVGPSTGFAIEGAALAVRELGIRRQLDHYRAPDGYVHVSVPALDRREPYRSEYEKRNIRWESEE